MSGPPIPIPTPTSTEHASSVTFSPTAPQNFPRTTPAPSTDSYPTTVVVKLETTLLIPNYPLYYPTPVADFSPNYLALPDGSLVTAPYRSDLIQANAVLLLLSILSTIFLRNVFVSGNYIRRIKVRQKILFFCLFASQVMAFAGLVPKSVSYLTSHLSSSCTSVMLVLDLAATLSIITIMSGIIGFKAYKCLDHSILVFMILSVLTVGAAGVSIVDVITLRAAPRLSGSCARNDNLRWIKIFMMIQLAQSLFSCCCFLYAVWKSRHSPVARDRISIQLSMDFQPPEHQPHRDRLNSTQSHKSSKPISPLTPAPPSAGRFKKTSAEAVLLEADSRQGTIREGSVSPLSSQSLGFQPRRMARGESETLPRPLSSGPPASLAPTTFSRISHYMPELFRKVMQDELLYTTIITSCSSVVAVVAVVGVASEDELSFMGWMCLYWGATSILATHSLGRAVSRHEREALLQAAALHHRRWDPDRFRATVVNRSANNLDIFSSARMRRMTSGDDSMFSDTQALTQGYSPSALSKTTDSPCSPRSFNSGSSLPLCPSPTFQFPTSGRTTPLVPLDSTRAVLPGNFVIDRNSSTSGSDYNLVRTREGSGQSIQGKRMDY
ncbi:hypothetical protein GYMLUDRAFT_66353 [Collybiopsis luxurians FD-317 M1]|nr:hypothetical protein GYMLUDRAFT_66353 [Collybiopsis luxurians FD-317 M1]